MSPQSFLCRGTPWCCWQKRLRERGCRKSSLCPWDTEPDRPEASLERRCGGVQGVALNFRQIFSELVPGGKGELVMQRRAPVPLAQDAEDGEEEAEQQNASEKYSGVKVKVGAQAWCRFQPCWLPPVQERAPPQLVCQVLEAPGNASDLVQLNLIQGAPLMTKVHCRSPLAQGRSWS